MKRKWLILLGGIVIVLVFIYGLINKNFFISTHKNAPLTNDVAVVSHNLPTTKDAPLAPKGDPLVNVLSAPNNFLLNVPFTSQAPFGVWDPIHNDACEEAALVMAQHWIDGHLINATVTDKEILDLISWEDKNWGNQYELTAERIAALGKEFFKIKNINIFSDPTVGDIKAELAKGNLIIVPVAGQVLSNPYYRSPGPIYHVLVIKGYDEKNFITNDPGTRHGEGYGYPYQVLLNAIHDWPYPVPDFGINVAKEVQAQKILTGGRVMLIISKN